MERLSTVKKIEEIRRYLDGKEYEAAWKLVQELDLDKLRSLTDMSAIAEICEHTGHYDKAYKLMIKVYARNKTRRVLYQMVRLSVRRKKTFEAEQYLLEYEKVAKGAPDCHILRFLLDKAEKKPLEIQIASLEKLKEYEYIEEWAYELAKLYHKAGLKDKCIRECNDIILWFSEGVIVKKAGLLKEHYVGKPERLNVIRAEVKRQMEDEKGMLKTKDLSQEKEDLESRLQSLLLIDKIDMEAAKDVSTTNSIMEDASDMDAARDIKTGANKKIRLEEKNSLEMSEEEQNSIGAPEEEQYSMEMPVKEQNGLEAQEEELYGLDMPEEEQHAPEIGAGYVPVMEPELEPLPEINWDFVFDMPMKGEPGVKPQQKPDINPVRDIKENLGSGSDVNRTETAGTSDQIEEPASIESLTASEQEETDEPEEMAVPEETDEPEEMDVPEDTDEPEEMDVPENAENNELYRFACSYLEEDDYVLTKKNHQAIHNLVESVDVGASPEEQRNEMGLRLQRVIEAAERRNMERLLEIVNQGDYEKSGLLTLVDSDFMW